VMLMGDPRSGMFGPAGSAQSQDDGRFVIGEVTAGSYRVNASFMIIGGRGRGGVGSGGSSFAVSSGVPGGVTGGLVTFGAGGLIDVPPPTEIVVADADVDNVRVVTRRPDPR